MENPFLFIILVCLKDSFTHRCLYMKCCRSDHASWNSDMWHKRKRKVESYLFTGSVISRDIELEVFYFYSFFLFFRDETIDEIIGVFSIIWKDNKIKSAMDFYVCFCLLTSCTKIINTWFDSCGCLRSINVCTHIFYLHEFAP